MDIDREALEEWQKGQPLCILSLDPADRAVLRVAGRNNKVKKPSSKLPRSIDRKLPKITQSV